MPLPKISNWKEYLLLHPDRHSYDTQASDIQSLINPNETPQNNFRLLSENKTLVCISKASMGNNIQLTFFNSIKKTAILCSESEFFALTGFTERASAVRLDPNDLFKMTTRKIHFPSFEEIIKCNSLDDIKNLVPDQSMDSEKMDHHSILPPILYESLMDLENLKPETVLLQLITKIKNMKKPEEPCEPFPPDSDEDEYIDISNMEVPESEEGETNKDENDEILSAPIQQTFDDETRSFEKRFYRPLRFLWCLIHASDKISGVPTLTCNIPSTVAWLDKIHKEHLTDLQNPVTTPGSQQPRLTYPHLPDHQRNDNVASSLNKLATTLDFHYENELKAKAEKLKKKEEKQYDNLSEVQKTIIRFITAKPGHTDDDTDSLEPTQTMRTLLEQGSSIKVQAQLQHEFSRRRFICALSTGMCTSIKQGTLASQPSHTDINGLSPFCTPNENKDDKMDHSTLLYMSEQLELGKVCAADVKQITKLSITFPTEFSTYVHYLKNYQLLLELLTGAGSILSLSVQTMVEHALDNERTYRDHGEEWTFFPSILDHVHRRTQMFIHSAGEGMVSKLRTKQIDFTFLMENIEGYTYHYHTPKWLKSRKRSIDEQGSSGSGSAPKSLHSEDKRSPNPPGNKNKREDKRGEKIINRNVNEKLKVPSEFKYGDIFRPEQRRGLTAENHDDGTIKCNNWHHRGFCYGKCKLRASHEKKLSESEITCMQKYKDTLIEKWKSAQGENN